MTAIARGKGRRQRDESSAQRPQLPLGGGFAKMAADQKSRYSRRAHVLGLGIACTFEPGPPGEEAAVEPGVKR
jgi:hypothetical protein